MSLSELPPRSPVPYAKVLSRPVRRRSGILSSYLFLLLCASVVSLVMFCSRRISLFGDIPDLPIWGAFQSGLTIVFLLAVWQWRRWGLYGVVGITLIGSILSLAYGQSILESLIPLFLAVALVLLAEQSWELVGDLEWRWDPEPTVLPQAPQPETTAAVPSQAPEPEPTAAVLPQAPEPEPTRPGPLQAPEPEPWGQGLPQAVPYSDLPSPPVRQRSGVLTSYLFLLITASVISWIMCFSRKISLFGDIPALPIWGVVQASLSFIFLIAIWQWRRWGFYGIVGITFVGFLLSLVYGRPIFESQVPSVFIVALGLLVKPCWSEMSDKANLWEPPLMDSWTLPRPLDPSLPSAGSPPRPPELLPRPQESPPRPAEFHPGEPPATRQRTGCFTTYLLLMIFGGIFTVFLYLFGGDFILRTVPSLPAWAIPAGIIQSALGVACSIAVWNWRRWGVFGLFVLIALNVVLSLGGEHSGAAFLIGCCQALIFALLLIPHWKHMEG